MEVISKSPLVSVIITTYNYGEFIKEAIESVLSQNFPKKDIEIIVVDDGSTDNTREKVEKYKKEIKYIYKENGGQNSAFNVGFFNSNGKYLILLDADDFCKEDRVEKVVKEFEENESVGLVAHGFKLLMEKELMDSGKKPWEPDYQEFHNLNLIQKENIYLFFSFLRPTSAISVRREILRPLMPFPENFKIGTDMFLNLYLIWFGNVSSLKEKLVYYRIHHKNLWSDFDFKSYRDKLNSHLKIMDKVILCVNKVVKNSPHYDPYIFEKISRFWKTGMMQKILDFKYISKTVKRKDIFKIESENFKLRDDWNLLYKFFKIFKLPFLTLFEPNSYLKFKELYSEKKLFKIRKLIFPD